MPEQKAERKTAGSDEALVRSGEDDMILRHEHAGAVLVTPEDRNTGLFEPIGGCGPANMTNR